MKNVKVRYDSEVSRFDLPGSLTRAVVKVVADRGTPTWITREAVLFEMMGPDKKRATNMTRRGVTHTIKCLRIEKDGKLHRYVLDNEKRARVGAGGSRLRLVEMDE